MVQFSTATSALALLLSVTGAAAEVCQSYTLDFDSLSKGDYITTQLQSTYGVTVSASGGYTPGGAARVFDTTDPGTRRRGDPDLGSPNQDCLNPGPGVGVGGGPHAEYPNCDGEGMVLIIQERDTEYPDDHRRGGTMTFSFDKPVTFEKVAIMDSDNRKLPEIKISTAEGDIVYYEVPNAGENSLFPLIMTVPDTTELQIDFPGSGAVASIDYTVCEEEVKVVLEDDDGDCTGCTKDEIALQPATFLTDLFSDSPCTHSPGVSGQWVCRSLTDPTSGLIKSFSACIETDKFVRGDTGGCCGGECPTECSCSCTTDRGDHGFYVANENDPDCIQCYTPYAGFRKMGLQTEHSCLENCAAALQ